MGTFKLQFNTDNAAFRPFDDGDLDFGEVLRVLADARTMVARSESVPSTGRLYDINGNTIGTWSLSETRRRKIKRNPPKRRKVAKRRTTRKPARSRR